MFSGLITIIPLLCVSCFSTSEKHRVMEQKWSSKNS